MKTPLYSRHGRRLATAWLTLACLSIATVAIPVRADSELIDSTTSHQQRQQALQQQIDNADDKTKALLKRLREANESADRLERYNQTIAPMLGRQRKRIEQQRQALAAMDDTRQALPATLYDMVDRLRTLVQADLPFRRHERLARLDSLDRMLGDASLSPADKLKRVLSAWQTEVDYGTDIDAWRGPLYGHDDTEVQYLRLGRIGWYYLSLDGDRGGVWKADNGQWQSLDGAALEQVRRGIRIANDQRSPELLSLPLSVPLDHGGEKNSAAANVGNRPDEGGQS